MTKRFEEMVKEDARRVAAEWIDVGVEDARVMLQLTKEAMASGDFLPEPAEFAKEKLRSYMTPGEVEIAWPTMVQQIARQLSLVF